MLWLGFVVLGSNGEYPLLSSEEKVQLVSFVKKHVSADKLVIAGSGCECELIFYFKIS